MLTLKTNFLKYKDENGNMQDSGMLFAQNQTDITLTEVGVAADAKAVGDALKNIEVPQSDWNQNDETAKDYIKNRPFYESDLTTIIEDTNIVLEAEGEIGIVMSSQPLEIDKEYIVTVNGIQYNTICKMHDSFGIPYLGNAVIAGGEDPGEDTGEVFFIAPWDSDTEFGIMVTNGATEYTISITLFDSSIIKIDSKFLPEIAHPEGAYIGKKGTGVGAEIFNFYESLDDFSTYAVRPPAQENKASGDYSHSEGYNTNAGGMASHAEGMSTSAWQDYCHAEGYATIADGEAAHAEGTGTYSLGMGSHSEGCYCRAWADYSHVEGYDAHAHGIASHAEGYVTNAYGDYQHVQGRFNIEDVDDDYEPLNRYAHIVGNGSDYDYRSNAHTIDWDGNAWFAGDVYVGSTSGTNMDEGSKKLVTEDKLNDYYLKTEADTLHSELHDYVNTEVAALVNAAPETLDTLGELAAAFNENKEVVEALDASITNKQDKISDSLILADTVTGAQYKIQIQNGQLVSFPV